MKRAGFAVACVLFSLSAWAAPATMRVDVYHTGNDKEERFSLDRVVIEPLDWPGNPARALDTTDRGKYFFEVVDAASGRALYSRGYSSIYGEWETTAEAKVVNRTFSESLRFPAVDRPVRLSIRKRDARNAFQEIWSVALDPSSKFIERHATPSAGPLIRIHDVGQPSDKLDLLIIGDGYTEHERSKCEQAARRMASVLFSTEPFAKREQDINVWGLCPAATESGISRPSDGIYRRSPLGTTYDAFDLDRYILTFDNRAFRDLASNAPYDVVEILTNTEIYGGGGIFNLFSTVAADNLWAPYIFVHEFGHQIAGLADEYYTSDVPYAPAATRVEPWEPNITALLDPSALKWKDLVAPGTPLPTPWPKAEYESYAREVQERRRTVRVERRPEAEMDGLLREEAARELRLLNSGPYAGRIGAFEGANYEPRGYFRPETDCVMFTRNDAGFCAVCRRAIEQILDLYTRR